MTDDIELTASVPLTPEEVAMLADPEALEIVERKIARDFARVWREEMDRCFLYGPRP